LIAPADSPVRISGRACGKCRARPRSTPTW